MKQLIRHKYLCSCVRLEQFQLLLCLYVAMTVAVMFIMILINLPFLGAFYKQQKQGIH